MADASRRKFLGLLVGSAVATSVGCRNKKKSETSTEAKKNDAKAPPRVPEETPLVQVVFALGPWPQIEEAKDFADRLLGNEKRAAEYKEMAEDLAALAKKLSPGFKIKMASLPEGERNALLKVSSDLYSKEEIYYASNGLPPNGQCMGNSEFPARPPK